MRRLQNIKKIAALTVETLCLSSDTILRTITQITWSKSKKKIIKRFWSIFEPSGILLKSRVDY